MGTHILRTVTGSFHLKQIDETEKVFEVQLSPELFSQIVDDCYGVITDTKSFKKKAVKFVKMNEGSNCIVCEPLVIKDLPIYKLEEYHYTRQHEDMDAFFELLAEFGMLKIKLDDIVLVCPDCLGIHTVRPGCPVCGSANIRPDLLIHHYACGNVDFLNTYIIDHEAGHITCPKCHKDKLIINADYDVSHGVKRCFSCGWTGNQPKLIGECLSCDTRFLNDEAKYVELKTYSLNEALQSDK